MKRDIAFAVLPIVVGFLTAWWLTRHATWTSHATDYKFTEVFADRDPSTWA